MVERLLDLADDMIRQSPRSSAVKRRAVSTAYYAAFHSLMRTCADAILPDTPSGTKEYERVYRAIDHGSLKNAFSAGKGALKDVAALREIGELIVPLQSARINADYSPPRIGFYEGTEAQDHLARARNLIKRLDALSREDRIVLAVNLIFKDRTK
jgi:hypothetical protein